MGGEPGFRVGPTAFTTVAGTAITVVFSAKLDIARREALSLGMVIAAALTDAVGTIAARLQFSPDGTRWDTVAYTDTVLGNATVSASAPEVRRATVCNRVYLDAPARAYEPGSSAGATDLVAASARDQPFPAKIYASGVQVASWRVQLVQVDADSDASFGGTVAVWVT